MILLVRINPNISPLYYGVLGLVILIRSISIVPLSLLLKTINFRSFFFTKIFTTLVHFLTVYILIFFGLSEWALVLSLLLSEIIYHFTVFIFNKWHPICFFSFKLLFLSMKTGILYTLINLSNNFHYQIKSFLVGQFFSLESLAFYQKGIYLPTLLMTQTDGVISSIALPLLTAVNDKFILLNVYRRLIKSSFTIVFPMLVGLYVVAEDLILVLFGITWLDSVEFLRASVILVSTWPFLLRVNLFHSIGKSKISFFINIVENFLTISVLIYIYQYGIVNMLYSNFLISLLFVFLSSIIQKKLINYTFKDQISDLLPPLLISLCMGILIVQINLSIFPLLKLLIKSFLGIVTYVMLSVLFKNESFKYLIKLVKFKLFKNTKFL
jgi:O-antigen/teichoic acid export membrane protein